MQILNEAERVIERFRKLFETPAMMGQIGYNVVNAALEYVKYNECGVALELLSTQLLDNEILISEEDFLALDQFANTYGFTKDADLDNLKKLIV